MNHKFSIEEVSTPEGKESWRELLLLADPSWEMILRYLGKGTMLVIKTRGEVIGEAVYSALNEWEWELHNVAIVPEEQGRGYGRKLVEEVMRRSREAGVDLLVGTAVLFPEEKTFYEHLGFEYSHVVEGFFTDNYDPPPVDEGVTCRDMTYFRIKGR